MKPFRGNPASCSCTGCVYRSRSKLPNIQQIIQGGSEIDKLYYGKFLPLRERKLLEKLIRTRDVYDDVRNQLLSSASGCPCDQNTSGEHKKKRRNDSITDSSSTVLDMVDMGDKGRIESGHTSKLSNCCSCCSCETLRKIRKRMEKDQRKHPPPVHRRIVNCEDIAKFCAEAEERGKKRRRKLSTHISPKIGSASLKMKKHLSEPCACTPLSIRSVSTYASKAFKESIRSKKKVKETDLSRQVTIDQKTEFSKVSRKPRKKSINIQSSTTKDSRTEVRSPIFVKVKKDSIKLFKDKQLKKRTYDENQDVECECFANAKTKGGRVKRERKSHSRHSATGRDRSYVSESTRTKNVKVRESRVQHEPCPCPQGQESNRESFYSMSTIPKTKLKQSVSKFDIKGKNPKPRKNFENAAKLETSSNLTKSSASMTYIPKLKTKAQSAVKEPSPKRELSRQKPKRELHQNLGEVDLQEHKGHVKVKNKKRVIPTHGKIKQNIKHQHSETQFKASQETYLREANSQATEFYDEKVLPFPRECEPLMCIPYECDPEECDKIYKSRGKTAKISTDRLRRKSVGSEAFSQRTSSRSRSKSKHNESKSADIFAKKTTYVSEEPSPYIVEKNTGAENYYPDKKAVKISSSFSFNIDFYKDTFPGEDCVCVEKVDKKKSPIADHENKIKPKEHRRKYKDHGTGYSSSKDRGTGDSSSRYNISSQSFSSQSSKNIQVGHKLKRCVCTLKLLQKKKQKITHTVSKKTMASLQNKEMEMGIRKKRIQTKQTGIGIECECPEEMKQRHRRAAKHVSKEINTAVTPRVSAFTSPVSKSSKKMQSAENRKIKQKERHSQSPNIEPEVSSDKSGRQAVRIGSNLSINIEFSKSNINDDCKCDDTTANVISDMPRNKERKHLHQKGMKVKPRVRHKTSETVTNDVKAKQTYTEPFLKRCLCTLKLLNKNKKKVEALSPWQNRNEYVMRMQNERSKILPDEYGSSLCPYPYNYEKFIKFRQMRLQHKYSNKVDLGSRPTFSKAITSSKSSNFQYLTEQPQQKIKKINRYYYETNMPQMGHASKQRFVRVESNLSNNIHKRIHSKDKFNSLTGFPQFNRPSYHKSKDADPICNNSSVVSTIKRYFSTLKFQNKRNKVGLKNKTNEINELIKTSIPVPNSQKCEFQSPSTILNKYHYGLRSRDCAPNSCKPGMCDRYECYEENKRRRDHYVSTNKRERTTLNITKSDFSCSTNANSTDSRLLKHKTTKKQNLRDKQKFMNAAVSFSPSLESNRGSKNRTEKYNILSAISTVNKNTEDRHATKESILQANKFQNEAKTSNAGFLLKKCLCTLGLQKKILPKSQFHWQQPVTTQFVQVEHYDKKTNMYNVSNSGPNALEKTLYVGNPLKSKLPDDAYVFRENFIPQSMLKNNSYSRRVHIRSSIDLSFDKMKCLLNPFYKSFYALNVKISKAKNKPQNKYRALNEDEREPGDCEPNECDPDDCTKRLNRLQRFKIAMKPKVKPKVKPDDDCYEKCKAQFTNEKKRKKQRDKSEDRPLVLGTDMKIRAGVYKDIDPYKNKRHQAIRVGSDVSVNFDFFKEPRPCKRAARLKRWPKETDSIASAGPLPPKPGRKAARLKRWPGETDSIASAGSLPPKPGRRAARPERWPEETDSIASAGPLPRKPGRKAARLKRWPGETDSIASAGPLPPKPGRRAARPERWPEGTDSNASAGPLPQKPGRRAARPERWPEETDSIASEGLFPPKSCRKAARLKRWPRKADSIASAGPLPPKPGRRAARPERWPEETDSIASVGPSPPKPGRKASKLKRWPGKTDSNASAGPLPPKPDRRAARPERWPEETDSIASAGPSPPKPGRKASRLKRWPGKTDSNASAGPLQPKPGKRAARPERWPEETDSIASAGPLPPKPDRKASRMKRWSGKTDSNASAGPLPPKPGRRAARPERRPEETDSIASAGPLPPKPGRKASRLRHWPGKTDSNASAGHLPPKTGSRAARPERWPEKTDSKGISHMIQNCFCKAKMMKAYGTKSEINQKRDVTKTDKEGGGGAEKLKSMTRILRRKETPVKSKSVQHEDYTKRPHKYSRKKDRNNVTFCTDVNCLFYNDGHKRRIGRGGDGDAEKHPGPELGIPDMPDEYAMQKRTRKGQKRHKKKRRRRNKRKKRKLKIFVEKCFCHLKKGKKLRQKQSMERIGPCKQLERAEREMETIMPYSMKKFKKIDSRPELSRGKRVCPKCRTASPFGTADTDDNTCLCPPPPPRPLPLIETPSFSCLCRKAQKCPVCKAKEAGTFDIKKFMKTPCTCMEEPKVEEPKKDLSKCPMCKQNYKKGVSTCPCCKKPFAAGGASSDDAAFRKAQLDLNKPLFQMTVNKTNMRIVNKDEVIKKMGSSAKAMQKAQKAIDMTYHTTDCKCCACKLRKKTLGAAAAAFSMKRRKLNPCICGSPVCKKNWDVLKREQRNLELKRKLKYKKCVCGSPVCGEESEKMPEMLLEAAKQVDREEYAQKQAIIKEKMFQKARKKRVKESLRSAKIQMKKQMKDDKRQMKYMKKSSNRSGVALIAESLIDLGTFGSKAFCDVARYVCKSATHSRHAIQDMRDMYRDPVHAAEKLKTNILGMGFQGTLDRIKYRMTKMPILNSVRSEMESHPVTNYLVHMADRDPKKRMKRFKAKRYREPRDFQCSPYMASMRKRPCLRIYYMCPWFYPHCMSLLQIYKQFMDIFLFIFAVLVWSPCILFMEIVRGCLCCLTCQG